jgi:carbon-monoxide dehydrogenase medium subunit
LAPTSVEEVTAALAAGPARVFAGATDVIPQSRSGRPLAETMIDLKKIDRLMSIEEQDTHWVIGAAVPTVRLTENAAFTEQFPGLSEAAGLIGSDQVQSRASLGGNLCNASPAADSVPALVVNGARAVVVGQSGSRTVPVVEIVTGPGRTSLAPDEIVVEFEVDKPTGATADAYLRLIPRTEMDIAVVGAGARIALAPDGTVSEATVALGAVAPTVVVVDVSALVGRAIDDEALAAVAAAASAACNPIDDKRGTIHYRTKVAGVLAKRAVTTAAERAGGRA